MATTFPVALDDFTNPTAGDSLNTPAVLHSDQHANANDAIEALQAKVGIDSSADTNSLDYKVSQRALIGHNHSGVYEPAQIAASQAEVEAGTEASIRSFSPLRIAQAIAALTTGLTAGGATASGSTTLTATSGYAQSITPTGFGQYVTLPDATTLSDKGAVFSVQNPSPYPLGIKNFAGTKLGWIRPQSAASISLADSSAAAGVWVIDGISKFAVTGETMVSLTVAGIPGAYARVRIDADRVALFFNASSVLYGIIHNQTTGAWGAATLVRNAAVGNSVAAIKTATDQLLVTSCSSTTAFEAVVLSISGTTITVNTAATATLAGNITAIGRSLSIVACGSSYVVSYTRATTTMGIRAMTISGTTVTIGAETAVTAAITSADATYTELFGVSSSVILAMCSVTATGLVATPYTISGTSISAGTPATLTTNAGLFSAIELGTRWFVAHNNAAGSATVGSVVSVSGTTATASTTATGISSISAARALPITPSKALIYNSNGTTTLANIVTDSGGTASAGTELSTPLAGAATPISYFVLGNDFYLLNGTTSQSAGAAGDVTAQVIDCSGASPTLRAMRAVAIDRTLAGFSSVASPSHAYKWQNANRIHAGTTWAVVPTQLRGIKGIGGSLVVTTDNGNDPDFNIRQSGIVGPIYGEPNAHYSYATTSTGQNAINLVECAA